MAEYCNDSVGFLMNEIIKIHEELKRIENRLIEFENVPRAEFDSKDIRYCRCLEEKKILLSHLCELRLQLAMKNTDGGSTNYGSTVGAKRMRSASPPPQVVSDLPGLTNTNTEGEKMTLFPPGENLATKMDPPAFVIDRSNKSEVETNLQAIPPTDGEVATETKNDLPTLQMQEYLSTKMKLAQIMRDFNDKKVCFIGSDDSKVFIQQYHAISSRVKQGEDISQYLKGKLVVFVTGIDKKKKSITETKLFIPDYEVCLGYK